MTIARASLSTSVCIRKRHTSIFSFQRGGKIKSGKKKRGGKSSLNVFFLQVVKERERESLCLHCNGTFAAAAAAAASAEAHTSIIYDLAAAAASFLKVPFFRWNKGRNLYWFFLAVANCTKAPCAPEKKGTKKCAPTHFSAVFHCMRVSLEATQPFDLEI